MRQWLAAAIIIGAACPAAAARLEVIALQGSDRVAGAQACFSRPGDTLQPLERYLRFPEVRCFGADDVLDMPQGRWLLHVTHPSGMIAADAAMVTVNPPHPRVDEYVSARVQLRPAGRLELSQLRSSVTSGDQLAIYVSNGGTESLPMIIPVPPERSFAWVPAAVPVAVMVLRGGEVVGVSAPIVVTAGEKRVVDALPRVRSPIVITWVEFPTEIRQPGDHWNRIAAPVVEIARGDERLQPMIAPRPGFGSDGALFVFRDVRAGTWRLSVGGPEWKRDEIRIEATGAGTLVSSRGLITRPVAAVEVSWRISGEPAASADSSCSVGRQAHEQRAHVTVSRCQGLSHDASADAVRPEDCQVVAEAAAADSAARRLSLQVQDSGTYLVSFRLAQLPATNQIVSLRAGERTNVPVELEPFVVFGRLTMNGEPLRARIDFATGTASSDPAGRYFAALSAPPRDLSISVRSCDDGGLLHTIVPEEPLDPNESYDIDIRTNELIVRVTDQATNRAVPNAIVQVGVSRKGTDSGDFLPDVQAGDDGAASVHNVPTKQELLICAAAEGYSRACSRPIRVSDDRRVTVTVALPPRRLRGRVVSNVPISWGRVYFVAPDGNVRERASLSPDGTFEHSTSYTSPSYVVLVWNGVMHVRALPEKADAPLELRPDVIGRHVEVTLTAATAQDDAMVGLVVDGRYVPMEAFDFHQSARGLQSAIYARAPYRIPHLPASGAVEVLLGPSPTDALLNDLPLGADVFTVPHFAVRAVRKVVPISGKVAF